ncbi:precorrin-2 C(20)-methyltransferase [Thermodesulfobacteriota bacterium]
MSKAVYSIGLGPGDHELVTLKGIKCLERSDVVIVPQSNSLGRSVAKDIILNFIDESKILMYFFPMTNDKDDLKKRYTELAEKIKGLIDAGNSVSYVTIGDPTVFSTSNYITEKLIDINIDVTHIPGISTASAVSAKIGAPACVKGEHFGVYEMPAEVEQAVALIDRHPTTYFLKVHKRLRVLIDAVEKASPKSAHLASRVGLEGETLHDLLQSAPEGEKAYLSIAVVKRGAIN